MDEETDGPGALLELLRREPLGVADLQAFHRSLDDQKSFDTDVLRNLAYLTGEVGELVGAVRSLRGAEDAATAEAARAHVGEELADCLAYVVKLANYTGVDLQQAYTAKMRRNLTRSWPRKES